jgi:competence protein ComEC
MAEFWLHWGISWVRLCAAIPFGYVYVGRPVPLQHVLYYLALLGWLGASFGRLGRARWVKPVCLSLLLLTAVSFFWKMKPQGFSMTLLSAGRNEIIPLNVGGRTHLLMNAGRFHPNDQGNWIIAPYLRSQGIGKIHAVMLTDLAKKHSGGLPTLLRNFRVDHLWYPLSGGRAPSADMAGSKRYRSSGLRGGDRISMGEDGEIAVWDIAAGKLIVRILYAEKTILFVPSLERQVVEALQRRRHELGDVDLLVLPSLRPSDRVRFEKIFDVLDPDLAAMPHEDEHAEFFLEDRDIPLLTPERYGALTFTVPESQAGRARTSSAASAFLIRSYLSGTLGIPGR